MFIESIELSDYRNYSHLHIDFHKGTNVLYGDNAQGKTNILEAVYVCCTTKSHKGSKDKEMIRFEETDFAAAPKIDGISGIRILFRHLLPNALGMIVVNFLFLIPQAIFTEAFLSFLGVGLSAPTASLGTLIQEGRDRMILYPCELLAPLITLCVLLVVFHILAMAMERRGGQTD